MHYLSLHQTLCLNFYGENTASVLQIHVQRTAHYLSRHNIPYEYDIK